MTSFGPDDDLHGATFVDADLGGARFVRTDLSGAVMREAEVDGLDIDSPWMLDGRTTLRLNGVDVLPLLDAELDRRFPGRGERRAADPAGLRRAWSKVEVAWDAALARAAAMPPGTVHVRVDDEWSFAQTLRHLVMATDAWLGRAILELPSPFHPFGQPFAGAEEDMDLSGFVTEEPDYADVLSVRAGRVAMVRDFLADVTLEQLASARRNPWSPDRGETVLRCLHVILGEEWDHLRYALRDLDAIEAGLPGS